MVSFKILDINKVEIQIEDKKTEDADFKTKFIKRIDTILENLPWMMALLASLVLVVCYSYSFCMTVFWVLCITFINV